MHGKIEYFEINNDNCSINIENLIITFIHKFVKCANTPGSFVCSCLPGYQKKIDCEFNRQQPPMSQQEFDDALRAYKYGDGDISAGAAHPTWGHITTWNTEKVTSMRQAFLYEMQFNEDIGCWNVSSVTNMDMMFNSAKSFNQDVSGWDVSSVQKMSWTFAQTDVFNQDIGKWDVSSVIDMSNMFKSAKAFNHDIGKWDVSSVTNVIEMFAGAESFDQNYVGGWNLPPGTTGISTMFFDRRILSAENDKISFNHDQTSDHDPGSLDRRFYEEKARSGVLASSSTAQNMSPRLLTVSDVAKYICADVKECSADVNPCGLNGIGTCVEETGSYCFFFYDNLR